MHIYITWSKNFSFLEVWLLCREIFTKTLATPRAKYPFTNASNIWTISAFGVFYFFNYLGIIGSINTALQDAPIAKEFNTTKLTFFKINSSKTCYKQISLDNHLQHTAPIDTNKKYSKLYWLSSFNFFIQKIKI